MKLVILGNGPSLKEVNLEKVFKENDVVIGCNYIYKSGFIPHYYCLWDLNFFNHCPISPEKFFDMPCTFVINEMFFNIPAVKEAMIKSNCKLILVRCVGCLIQRQKIAKFPETNIGSGTIVNICIPLALEMCNGGSPPQRANTDKRGSEGVYPSTITFYGIDNKHEKRHFYEENLPNEELLDKLGVKNFKFDDSNTEQKKKDVSLEYAVLKRIIRIKKKNVKLINFPK